MKSWPPHRHLRTTILLGAVVLLLPQIAWAFPGQNLLLELLWWFVSGVFGTLVWITGSALDFTIKWFVVDFGTLFADRGLGMAINSMWTVVRDLFNLTFIFGLIYIGFRMIIDSDDSGAKKTIVNLIIAALLVNFSLFITKTIIDFSNIAAVQVANVIYQGGAGGPLQNIQQASIADSFLSHMGLSGALGPSGAAVNTSNTPPGLVYIIGSMLLFLIAAFTFAAGAALLAVRFVALNYFMVISPIMFIGRVFAPLQSWQSNFWQSLLKNAFFAPAFLLMLYFSLHILQNMGAFLRASTGNVGLLQSLSTPSQDSFTIIAFFLMAAGFLIGSVILAQKMSAVGGDVAVKLGKNLQGRGQRLVGSMTLGAGAKLGQRTIGQGAQYLNQREWMKDWAAKSVIGRQAYKATKKVGDASFDGRAVLAGAGFDQLGKGGKGGYATILKEREKADKKFAEELGKQKLADDSTADGKKAREAQLKPLKEKIEADNTTEGTSGYELKQAEIKQGEARNATTAAENELSLVQQNIAAAQEPERRKIALYAERLSKATDAATFDSLNAQIKASTDKMKSIEKGFEADLKAKEQGVNAARTAQKTADDEVKRVTDKITKEAEARYTYARQLAFIENRKSGRKWVRTRGGGGVTATGAAVGAGVMGGWAAAPVLIAGAAIASSYSTEYAAGISALEEEYGRNGSKKAKKEREKGEAKAAMEAIKKAAGTDDGDDKKSGDKKDKD